MKANKYIFLAGMLLSVVLFPALAVAGVDVHVTISPPPPFVIPAPPPLMLIPGTYVYFAPDIDGDIVFFQGYWYRPYRNGWYRSNSYNGRWVLVPKGRVPRALNSLPPDWRRIPPGQQRIPYGQVRQNWRQWERDRHWDRKEHREERRHDRYEERREHGRGGEGPGEGRGGGGHGRGKHGKD